MKDVSNLEKLVIEKIIETDWKHINVGEPQGMAAQSPVTKIMDFNNDSAEIATVFGE